MDHEGQILIKIVYVLIGLLVIVGSIWLFMRITRKPTIFEKYNLSNRQQIVKLLHEKETPKEDREELKRALDFFDAINDKSQ
jgi:hypothetical protein